MNPLVNPLGQSHSDWREAEKLLHSPKRFQGLVTGYNSRGLVVRFGSLHGFLPIFQISSPGAVPAAQEIAGQGRWPAGFVDQVLHLKVVEANQSRRRLIFSER